MKNGRWQGSLHIKYIKGVQHDKKNSEIVGKTVEGGEIVNAE